MAEFQKEMAASCAATTSITELARGVGHLDGMRINLDLCTDPTGLGVELLKDKLNRVIGCLSNTSIAISINFPRHETVPDGASGLKLGHPASLPVLGWEGTSCPNFQAGVKLALIEYLGQFYIRQGVSHLEAFKLFRTEICKANRANGFCDLLKLIKSGQLKFLGSFYLQSSGEAPGLFNLSPEVVLAFKTDDKILEVCERLRVIIQKLLVSVLPHNSQLQLTELDKVTLSPAS